MNLTEAQLDLVFRYFENSLSEEEEKQLMQQLQQSRDMQQAFDQEVLLRNFAAEEMDILRAAFDKPHAKKLFPLIASPILESADDFLNRVTGSLIRKELAKAAEVPASIVKTRNNYNWLAAAAMLICILGAVLFYQFLLKKNDTRVVNTPAKDTTPMVHRQQLPPPLLPPNKDVPRPQSDERNLQPLYAEYNSKPFQTTLIIADRIPLEASEYPELYKHQVKEMAAKSERLPVFKGTGSQEEEQRIANYFHFYKALANLQIGKTTTAENLLDKVQKNSAVTPELKSHIQWYLLMVYLKSNNKQAAIGMAKMITNDKRNAYYKKAVEIKERLNR